jgi:hypothetical protein
LSLPPSVRYNHCLGRIAAFLHIPALFQTNHIKNTAAVPDFAAIGAKIAQETQISQEEMDKLHAQVGCLSRTQFRFLTDHSISEQEVESKLHADSSICFG